jgi:hypothetical protein
LGVSQAIVAAGPVADKALERHLHNGILVSKVAFGGEQRGIGELLDDILLSTRFSAQRQQFLHRGCALSIFCPVSGLRRRRNVRRQSSFSSCEISLKEFGETVRKVLAGEVCRFGVGTGCYRAFVLGEPLAKAENKNGNSFRMHRTVIAIDIRIRRGF